MGARRKKVRTIVFGIRFKLSLIIIGAIVLASTLLGLALNNQHERKLLDSLHLLGAATLKGAEDRAQQYLSITHLLRSDRTENISRYRRYTLDKKRREALKGMEQHFAGTIRKEKILDISFLIDITWSDIGVDWKKWNQSKYYYFSRSGGAIFTQGKGRKDPLLEPTILSHYMQHVDADSHLAFTDLMDDENFRHLFQSIKRNYLVVGIPIFHRKGDRELYADYTRFQRQTVISRDTLGDYFKTRDRFINTFTRRIIDHGLSLDYGIALETDRKRELAARSLLENFNLYRLRSAQRSEAREELIALIEAGMRDTSIALSQLKAAVHTIRAKYNLSCRSYADEANIWKNLYSFLQGRGIKISVPHSLEELALLSFRKDIAGVLGLFLLRHRFFAEMERNRAEIINLILSILLRVTIIALLIPGFLIRAITRLSEGAVEIGKGNLDTRIDIRGTDELGRLADVFNVMTVNLKKAQEWKIEKYRMENELITAQQIQAALLPGKLPDSAGMSFGAYYSAQTESGGDYYDFIDLGNNRIGIAIADVSGHGVGSGLVMAITRTLLHIYCRENGNTKATLEKINTYLKENTASNYFVTMFYGILNLDTLQLTYSSAGHNQGILLRDGQLQELPSGGIALGVASEELFSKLTDVRRKQLQRGDTFVQFTDGVNESVDAEGIEFGLDRFYRTLRDNDGKSPQEMIDAVVQALQTFIGTAAQDDDITIIAFRIT